MATISIDCLNCQTTNTLDSSQARVECGILYFECTCSNCGAKLDGKESYEHWLELDRETGRHETPPAK